MQSMFQKLKPGERAIIEVACIKDEEGRITMRIDLVEKRDAKPKPLNRRKKPLTTARAVG